MEGLRTVNANVAAFIHPSRGGDVAQGAHEILNSLLLRFNEQFDGVILAYVAPKLVGRTAKILSGLSPYFHVNVTAKLLVFSPVPGIKIEGKVNKIERNYIGVVVFGLFNGTIGADDIRDDFEFSTEHHSGQSLISTSDNRHTIEVGSLIRFSVKSLQEAEHIIDISGSLIDDKTGNIDWLERHAFRSRSKGSKEGKLRVTEDKEAKQTSTKDTREFDIQELMKHAQKLEQTHSIPMNETGKVDTEEPRILHKHKKKKRKESG